MNPSQRAAGAISDPSQHRVCARSPGVLVTLALLFAASCASDGPLQSLVDASKARHDAHEQRVSRLEASIEEGEVSCETALGLMRVEMDYYKGELEGLARAISEESRSVLGGLDPTSAAGGGASGVVIAWLAAFLRRKLARGANPERTPNEPPAFPS